MAELEKTFVGQNAWVIVPDPDLLLWWEGEHIRIDKVGDNATVVGTGRTLRVDTPIYLHPASPAWEQAAQLADEED